MEEFITPRGEELERRFQQLSTEFLLLGYKVSVEFLKSRYDQGGVESRNRHFLNLNNFRSDINNDHDIIPINSLIEFDPLGLSLEKNKLAEIPEKFGELKSIIKLRLGENQFTTLPDSIGNLLTLQYLSIRIGKLTELPPSISKLQNLKILNLESNDLSTIPNLSSAQLKELYIQFNDLKSLPGWLSKIKSLEIIDLRGIGLKKYPDLLNDLPNLKEVHLGDNNIVSPEKIGKLEKYEWVWSDVEGAYIGEDGYFLMEEDLFDPITTYSPPSKKVVRYYTPDHAPKFDTFGYNAKYRKIQRTYPQFSPWTP